MKTAFIIFDKLTTMDFIGIYDPLSRLRSMDILPDFEWRICAPTAEVTDDRGLRLAADRVCEPLDSYDMVVVPGGFGTRALVHDAAFIQWLGTCEPCRLKVSVCTGALLPGAAGFLKGRQATTHPSAFRELEPFCDGVLAGSEARTRVARQMDYPYACESVHVGPPKT